MWENFSAKELSCPCCEEYYHDETVLNALQEVRDIIGKPIRINSAHRCEIHNALVGGAPMSQHKLIAVDISLHGHDRHKVLDACVQAGFNSFGFYNTFLHVDMRKGRRWYGKGAKSSWNG